MKAHAEKGIELISNKSALAKGYNYFLNNYAALTLFLKNSEIPIDNNASERVLEALLLVEKLGMALTQKKPLKLQQFIFPLLNLVNLIRLILVNTIEK